MLGTLFQPVTSPAGRATGPRTIRPGPRNGLVGGRRSGTVGGVSDRWFCFLRAINTGDRRVTNELLLDAFASFGVGDVEAYRAAGNVTFRAEDDLPARTARLAGHLAAELGFECPLFLRRSDDLRAIAGRCPFTDSELAGTEGRVQLTFLEAAPKDEAIAEVRLLVPDDDRVVLAGQEWWWLPSGGVSGSVLPVRRIETILGPMTMRTKATIDGMLARFAG